MKRWSIILVIIILLGGCALHGKTASDDDEVFNIAESTILPQETIVYQTSFDFSKMSLSDIMNEIMEENHLNQENFAVFFENTVTHEYYGWNEELLMTGASTIKVLVNMMFYDLDYDIENTALLYRYEDYEDGGGFTAVNYAVGEMVPLSYLMEQSIVYSDNTAINIMIDELGFDEVRETLASYSSTQFAQQFYYENLTSAELLHGVLTDLYEHGERYEDLLEQMKDAMPQRYMKGMIEEVSIAHKYGEYGTYQHDFGIVYTKEPILIGILSDGVTDGEELIAYITRVLYEYQVYHENNQ